MKRTFYVVAGVYLIMYCTLLNQYIMPSYAFSGYIQYIPLLFLIPLFVPRVMKLLDRVMEVKTWTLASIVVMTACTALQLGEIKGFWGSWPTIGLLFAIVILIMNLTEGKLTRGKSFLLGCGCAFISNGVCEIVYITGFLIYHDYPGSYPYDVMLRLIWLLAGTTIILCIPCRRLIHFNGAFAVCTTLAVMSTAIWCATGFKTIHFYSEHEFLAPLLVRSSRLFVSLAPAMLLLERK